MIATQSPHSNGKVIRIINARLVGKQTNALFDIELADGRVQTINPAVARDDCTTSTVEFIGQTDLDGSKVVDLRGNFLAPSLVDHHVHSAAWTHHTRRLDLSNQASAAGVLQVVAERLLGESGSETLVGCGFRVGAWPDLEALNLFNLDRIAANRPVALICSDLHSMVCNTAALNFLNIPVDEYADGWLREKPCFDATVQLGDVGDEKLDEWIAEMALQAAAKGVTEIVDFEMNHNIRNWTRRIQQKGFRTLRVRAGMYQPHINDAISRGLKTGDTIPETAGLLTVGPYKIITDGSLGTQTAFCHAVYPGTQNRGLWIYPDETLQSMAEYGTKNSLTLAIHAIGDQANHRTLRILDSLSPPSLSGSSIEHAQLVSENDVHLFKKLGLIASVQPEHLNDDRELCGRYWPHSTGRAFAFKSLLDAGVVLKLGSDAPVAALDPWRAIAAAVSRCRGAVDAGGEFADGFHPEQKIGRADAWIGSTSNGKAAVSVGDVADFCVLESDPLNCDLEQLRNMKVLGTMLGGNWTFKLENE
ncbi:hypothetical protein HK100_005257, partial [Physocladia obscura]